MKKSYLFFVPLFALSVCLVSCDYYESPANTDNNSRGTIELTETEKTIIKSNREFSFRLFDAVNRIQPGNDKFVISPMSASFAFSMLLNGVVGETLENSMGEFGLQGIDIEELNAINRKLIEDMSTLDKKTDIEFANSLWLNEGSKPEVSYINVIKKYYNGSVQNRQFCNEETLNAINDWCSNATKGNITKLLKELDPYGRMLLINTLYFNAPWKKNFKSSNTDVFNTVSGELQQVAYMECNLLTACYSNGKSKAVVLPYGNDAFSFSILLPNEGGSLDECIADLANEDWISGSEHQKRVDLNIRMPKFKIEGCYNIVPALESTGIKTIFKKDADYSNLFPAEPFFVNKVIQATTFKVDEKGSEGSATTVFDGDSSVLDEKMEMVVNRPFLFFVKESSTGAILFIGKVGKI